MTMDQVSTIPGLLEIDPAKPRLAASGTAQALPFAANDYWELQTNDNGFRVIPNGGMYRGLIRLFRALAIGIPLLFFCNKSRLPKDAQATFSIVAPILSLMFLAGSVLTHYWMKREQARGAFVVYSQNDRSFFFPRNGIVLSGSRVVTIDVVSGCWFRWSDGRVTLGNGPSTQIHLLIQLADHLAALPIIASSGSMRLSPRIAAAGEQMARITNIPFVRVQEETKMFRGSFKTIPVAEKSPSA